MFNIDDLDLLPAADSAIPKKDETTADQIPTAIVTPESSESIFDDIDLSSALPTQVEIEVSPNKTEEYLKSEQARTAEESFTTMKDLFIQVRTDERIKIQDLSIDELTLRLNSIEKIITEAKARSVEILNKKRSLEEASGKNRWDKASGPKVKSHLANIEGFGALLDETKKHARQLTKCEKAVAGFVELGESDDDIISVFNKKFNLAEIKEAIKKAREAE